MCKPQSLRKWKREKQQWKWKADERLIRILREPQPKSAVRKLRISLSYTQTPLKGSGIRDFSTANKQQEVWLEFSWTSVGPQITLLLHISWISAPFHTSWRLECYSKGRVKHQVGVTQPWQGNQLITYTSSSCPHSIPMGPAHQTSSQWCVEAHPGLGVGGWGRWWQPKRREEKALMLGTLQPVLLLTSSAQAP